jgi:hypothetical protein
MRAAGARLLTRPRDQGEPDGGVWGLDQLYGPHGRQGPDRGEAIESQRGESRGE